MKRTTPLNWSGKVKTCPKCKLISPPSAQRCDCGYDFDTGQMEASYLSERDKQIAKRNSRISAAAILALVLVHLVVVRKFPYLEISGWLLAGLAMVVVMLVWALKKKPPKR